MNPEDVVMAQGGPEGPPPEAAPQGPPPEAQQQAEPYGASLLRRVHEDAAMLLMEYDEHLAMLDNPEVRAHMTELLKTIDKLFLGATEKVFKRQYKQLPPLDGGGAPPDGGPDGGPPPDEGPPDDGGGEEFEVAEEGPPAEEEAGEEENPKERPTPRPPEKGIGVTGQKSLPRQGVKMPVNKRAMDVGTTAYRDSDGETKDDRRGDAVIASQAHIAEEASESIAAGDRDTARRVLGDARDTREAMNRWVDEHGKTLYDLRVGSDGRKYMVPVAVKALKKPKKGDSRANQEQLADPNKGKIPLKGQKAVNRAAADQAVVRRLARNADDREGPAAAEGPYAAIDRLPDDDRQDTRSAAEQESEDDLTRAFVLYGNATSGGGDNLRKAERLVLKEARQRQEGRKSASGYYAPTPADSADDRDDPYTTSPEAAVDGMTADTPRDPGQYGKALPCAKCKCSPCGCGHKTLYQLRVGTDGKKYMVPVAVKAYGADHKVTTQRIAREDERRGLDDSAADDWERAHYDMEVEDLAEYGTPTLDDGTNRVKALPPEFALDEELAGIERHPEGVDVNPQGQTAYQQEASLFEQHELGKLQEAVDFLHEIAAEEFNSWGDEHRFKSFHFHKCLEPMGMRVHTKALVGNKSGADDPYGNWGDDGGPVPDYDPDYNPNDEEPHTAASGSSRRHTHGPHAGKEHYKGVKATNPREYANERRQASRRVADHTDRIRQESKEEMDGSARETREIVDRGPPQDQRHEGKSLDPAACYGSCGQASGFFKMLANEKAFGMPHQHEAMKHAQALCSILDAFGPSTNPADGYNPELAMQAGVEPGEMREKSAAPEHGGLSAALAGQQKMLADLGEELKFLRGQAARFLH